MHQNMRNTTVTEPWCFASKWLPFQMAKCHVTNVKNSQKCLHLVLGCKLLYFMSCKGSFIVETPFLFGNEEDPTHLPSFYACLTHSAVTERRYFSLSRVTSNGSFDWKC